METYPEQFSDESQPDPSYRSEDPVFDAIQGTDCSDFTLWLSGVGRFGLQVKDIR